MLVSLRIENFLSFKDAVTFSLEAAPIKEHYDSNVFDTTVTGLRLLKGCAIYGANGSGKSNLLKALRFITRFINESAKESQANDVIDVSHFKLSTSTEGKPSLIEIKLISNDLLYRYGFEVDKTKVHREWLYCTKKIKEYLLFERNGNEYEIDYAKFGEGDDAIQSRTRSNVLFLSAVAQWNGETASNVIKGVNNIIFLGDEPLKANYTLQLNKDPLYKSSIKSLLDSADLGINSFITQQITYPESYLREIPQERKKEIPLEQVYMLHNKLDENNNIVGEAPLDLVTEESQGTKKFFYLAGYIVDAIINGKTLVIDEFTSRLHPVLATHIIETFHDKNINKSGAQLIFTTQNTYLMDIKWYRRDQICIIYKQRNYSSVITNFFKENIRNDASFEKRFLEKGSIGVPKLKPPIISNNQLGLFD